jgi:DNA-binding Xre family transcriptional regulator
MPGRPGDSLARQVALRISHARTVRRLSQDALAERLGIATRNLQRIESGQQNLTLGTIERIAAALGAPPGSLLPGPLHLPLPARRRHTPPRCVPVVALNATAGLIRHPQSVDVDGWWLLDEAGDGDFFVSQVNGTSMEPLIPHGAYALFRAQPDAEALDTVYLWQVRENGAPEDGGSFLVKRISGRHARMDGGVDVTLASVNRSHPPMVIAVKHGDELRAIARFVRVLD